jgi:predicted glutamine amidotransferase
MCRWLAYSGSPILLKEALYAPAHSLIDQSLRSRLGAEATNGDGFGVGWYDTAPTPGLFKSVEPAWNDRNLHELAEHISSGHFFAHVRAAIGSPVQQTNCHPFRHGRWLWMHNGLVAEYAHTKRDLVLAVDPSLYTEIEGGTDSEALFYLALTFGLEDDPPAALARTIGLVEARGRARGVEHPFQVTASVVRYAQASVALAGIQCPAAALADRSVPTARASCRLYATSPPGRTARPAPLWLIRYVHSVGRFPGSVRK